MECLLPGLSVQLESEPRRSLLGQLQNQFVALESPVAFQQGRIAMLFAVQGRFDHSPRTLQLLKATLAPIHCDRPGGWTLIRRLSRRFIRIMTLPVGILP